MDLILYFSSFSSYFCFIRSKYSCQYFVSRLPQFVIFFVLVWNYMSACRTTRCLMWPVLMFLVVRTRRTNDSEIVIIPSLKRAAWGQLDYQVTACHGGEGDELTRVLNSCFLLPEYNFDLFCKQISWQINISQNQMRVLVPFFMWMLIQCPSIVKWNFHFLITLMRQGPCYCVASGRSVCPRSVLVSG